MLGTQHWKEKPSSPQPQPKNRNRGHKWKHDQTWQKLQAAAWNRLRSSSVWKPEFDASGTWSKPSKTVENPQTSQTLSFISANFFELSSWRLETIYWCARINFNFKQRILNMSLTQNKRYMTHNSWLMTINSQQTFNSSSKGSLKFVECPSHLPHQGSNKNGPNVLHRS